MGRQVEGYACSNSNFWNDGRNSFLNPIPQGQTIHYIDVSLIGIFNCQIFQPGVEVYLNLQQDQLLYTTDLPRQPLGCGCPTCVITVNYTVDASFPRYNYSVNGTNQLQVIVTGNAICLHAINLTFHYQSFPRHDVSFWDRVLSEIGWIVAGGVVVLALLAAIIFVVYRKVRGRHAENAYQRLEEGEGGAVGDAGFSKKFEQVAPHEIKIGPRIGKGSFAEVFKARWRGTLVAVKKLPAHSLTPDFFEDFEREAALMKRLRHPNVLLYLGACMISPDICIVTEYMGRGSVYRILHDENVKLTWEVRRKFALDAARGMNYLHSSDPILIHRDLKSHNLLVDENWKVKVCDFGLSRIVEQTLSATMTACGTPCWTAPEVLRNARYTEKADIYSFGIVLWELATREDPYKGMPPFQVVFAVGTQKLRPQMPRCPIAWSRLVSDCWAEDPNMRPSFATILRRLEKLDITLPPKSSAAASSSSSSSSTILPHPSGLELELTSSGSPATTRQSSSGHIEASSPSLPSGSSPPEDDSKIPTPDVHSSINY